MSLFINAEEIPMTTTIKSIFSLPYCKDKVIIHNKYFEKWNFSIICYFDQKHDPTRGFKQNN